ncbi:TetR family transcriptional regulator [Micromonospora qiuiae]|uniref:TetR family transcriptional regulator n=1 Tax=Micromonospora qiuiae TaxID=502268 RepID=A0ABQ4JD48_9ACTN|nr:TetR/AcrR family transcriptional regulator [Micromonospora qiuiae]GIJ28093.1 TetR family transcriptional regulator [Micromonospora qiuiae]
MKANESEDAATPGRRRNRRGEGGKLRDEIVNAAAALLDESGDEHAVTLRSIARRIGIAAPSIYAHFPDQPAIMLAVVNQEFDLLAVRLRTAADSAGHNARQRLLAVGHAYLDVARTHPGRYRIMFGGLWAAPAIGESSITQEEMDSLGVEALAVLTEVLGECVAAGESTSDDVESDAIALWLGLHGLAHQRAVIRKFPWPPDIAERIITALAHLRQT